MRRCWLTPYLSKLNYSRMQNVTVSIHIVRETTRAHFCSRPTPFTLDISWESYLAQPQVSCRKGHKCVALPRSRSLFQTKMRLVTNWLSKFKRRAVAIRGRSSNSRIYTLPWVGGIHLTIQYFIYWPTLLFLSQIFLSWSVYDTKNFLLFLAE